GGGARLAWDHRPPPPHLPPPALRGEDHSIAVVRPPGRRAADLLHLAQILDGDVAADEVARLALDQGRLFGYADVAQEARTAGVEDAAGGRVGRARDLALETDARLGLSVQDRGRGEQRLGVWVMRTAEHRLRVAHLHQPAQVEHGD